MNNRLVFCPLGKVLAVGMLLAGLAPGAVSAALTADTAHPDSSTFAAGDTVTLKFHADGLTPAAHTTLTLTFRDADDAVVAKKSVPVVADAGGSWSGTVTAPSRRLGFYRVSASLADGTTLAKLGSRPDGFLTYAVVPNPARRQDYGEAGSHFGMQGGFSDKVNVIPYLGVRWVLGDYGLGAQENDRPGEFAEKRRKALAAGEVYPPKPAATEGVVYHGKPWKTYVIPSLNGTPAWAAIPGTTGTSTGALNPAGETEWPQYCAEAAQAFSANYPDYAQHLYQTTWEPVYPWGFKGTDAQLVRIFQLAYPALHKADPKAVVLGPTDGGIGGGDLAWTQRLLKAGLGRYIDGISIHPYFALPPERGGLVDDIRQLRATVAQDKGHDVPFYGTEQGYATGEHQSKELLQAQGLVRENLIMIGEGFRVNFAFYIADFAGEPGYGFYYNLRPSKPFGTDKTGPKPVAPAFAAMTDLIDGHDAVEPIEYLGPTSLGYVFQRGPDIVLALWDYGDKPNSVSLPVGTKTVTVYDWMGNARTVKASSRGQVTLSLGPEPIYVKGVSPALWGRNAKRPLTVSPAHLEVFPGQRVPIGVRVLSATGHPAAGRLVLQTDAAMQTAPQSLAVALTPAAKPAALAVNVPATLPAGRYMAKLTLDQGGASVGSAGVLLNVRSPLQISPPGPAFRDGHPVVTARFTNLSTAALDGDASLSLAGLPGARPTQPIHLKPGQTETVAFDCSGLAPSNSRLYSASIAARTNGGYRTDASSVLSFYPVTAVNSPPAPDADLAAWSDAPVADVQGRDAVVRSPQYYNGQLKAAAKFSWDAQNLYLAFDVTDPTYRQDNVGFDTWKGDCLQLEFNLDPNRPVSHTGNQIEDTGSLRASEIDLALTKDGPQAFRTSTFAPDKAPVRLLTASEITLAVRQTPGGLRYRAAIPWTTLGATAPPAPGQQIGFAAYVNDMNQEGQLDPTALGLFVRAQTKDPAQFGDLVLEPRR